MHDPLELPRYKTCDPFKRGETFLEYIKRIEKTQRIDRENVRLWRLRVAQVDAVETIGGMFERIDPECKIRDSDKLTRKVYKRTREIMRDNGIE